jgi:hypothetical protein
MLTGSIFGNLSTAAKGVVAQAVELPIFGLLFIDPCNLALKRVRFTIIPTLIAR